jgi:signal transduction histidine kinase
MEKAGSEIMISIIIASLILVILAIFTLLFLVLFNRKRKLYHHEKAVIKQTYEQALLQTKLEIQAQTMNDISREIHDNIGQVLSFVKLSLSAAPQGRPEPKKVDDCVQLLAGAISDLRDLSKSLSLERVKNTGLYQVIEEECRRLNRSKVIKAKLQVSGNLYRLPAATELVVFRIFQESMNNVLKHSGSEHVDISLHYQPEQFSLEIKDRGKGTEPGNQNGSGLINMQQRAGLIGSKIDFIHTPGQGFSTQLILPLTHNANYDGTAYDSPGG